MPDGKQEEAHLVQAEKHIAEAKQRIRKQVDKIERLAAEGQSTEHASKFVTLLLETLDLMQRHREQILRALDDRCP